MTGSIMTKVLRGGWVAGAMGVTLIAASGCGDTEDGSSGYCARFRVKLTDCGLSALFRDECEEPKDEEELCEARCAVSTSCQDFRDLFCLDESPEDSALLACLTDCEPPPFRCGSGESVAASSRCDGYEECMDGSDEVTDCPTCGSGEHFSEYQRCDGTMDCSDGLDERSCPTFRCANGELVPERAECDSVRDCGDGSDEHRSCSGFQCGSGELLPADVECDGFPQCNDGSDEPSTCPPTAEEQICGSAG